MAYATNKYGEHYIEAVEKFLENRTTVQTIKLSDVYTPQASQVRITAKLADHIDDLERNIELKGQEEPIIVEVNGNGGYDAVEGVNRTFTFRRLAANAPTDPRWFTIKARVLPQGFSRLLDTGSSLRRTLISQKSSALALRLMFNWRLRKRLMMGCSDQSPLIETLS